MGKGKLARVKILDNTNIAQNYFALSFKSPWTIGSITPGQFILVKVSDGLKPLLRKPFGVHRAVRRNRDDIIEILYEVVGEGTQILSKRRRSEILDVMGPLGNGFSDKGLRGGLRRPILIAGGIGVAPLLYLAHKLINSSIVQKFKSSKVKILIGAKTKKQILCEKEFRQLKCEVKITTDDGSQGHKGFVTDLLKKHLSTMNHKLSTIYACGPKPMLAKVARIAIERKIPCQVLLEEYMACGVGVCLGCAVMTKDGYKMVCKDGPVFEAGDVIWT